MEAKYKLEEESQLLKANYPNKFLDEELNYMKEIRETYFLPSKEDPNVEENIDKTEPKISFEITD